MAELESVSINEASASENISMEQQASEMDAANANKPQDNEAAQTVEQDRPEWLPEKFSSPEDMAKAYQSLEQKMSSEKPKQNAKDTKSDKEAPNTSDISNTLNSATEEFMEAGELSDKSFDSLEKAGLPRDLVAAYIEGQQALVDLQTSQIKEVIGGEGNYEAMAEWAAEHLSETDVDAFNSVVETGTVDQAMMAVRGMFAQFKSAGGKAPNLVQGGTAMTSGVKPFNSAAQVTEAMRDPKYRNDPAYRQMVQQRMSVTTAF